jgi:hypothetical protein
MFIPLQLVLVELELLEQLVGGLGFKVGRILLAVQVGKHLLVRL